MSDKELFYSVFETFKDRYDGLDMQGSLVVYKGAIRFNIEGFNLLYNLTRLCGLLKDELR